MVNDSAHVSGPVHLSVDALVVDRPLPDTLHARECVIVDGWAQAPGLRANVSGVIAMLSGRPVSAISRPVRRPDVVDALAVDEADVIGFELACRLPDDVANGSESVGIDVCVIETGGLVTAITRAMVRVLPSELRSRHYYANFLDVGATAMQHRSDTYRSGPSSPVADPTCFGLLLRRLDPGATVLDVGCGVGAYAHPLRAAGFDWFGVEVDDADCAALTEAGLPHRQIVPGPFPFDDASFDHVIAVEVLEHIEEPEQFVAELARVARRSVLLSVPNVEAVPLLQTQAVVPWHLLEGDHRNFFSRANLTALLTRFFDEVDVVPYGELPVRTAEGVAVYNHLLATAHLSG